MKLTNSKIILALKNGASIRLPDMPAHVFLKLDRNGKRLYISDWGQDMGEFKPYIQALEDDGWYVVKEETRNDK